MDRLVWQGLGKAGEGSGVMVQGSTDWLKTIKESYCNFPGITEAPPIKVYEYIVLIDYYIYGHTPQLGTFFTVRPPPVFMMFLGQFSAKKSFPHVKMGRGQLWAYFFSKFSLISNISNKKLQQASN